MSIEASINALITRRIIEFHNALVERGQIAAAPKPEVGGLEIPDEDISRYTADDAA